MVCSRLLLKRDTRHKHLSVGFNKKTCLYEAFELSGLKNCIYKGKCKTFTNSSNVILLSKAVVQRCSVIEVS